jgi:hypothetical protein
VCRKVRATATAMESVKVMEKAKVMGTGMLPAKASASVT